MKRLTGLIRADGEFERFVASFKQAVAEEGSLPLAVNGLSGGAERAFVIESVAEALTAGDSPLLILTGSDAERQKLCGALCEAGVNAIEYKRRDPVFHNIRASHDLDRERLSALSAIANGEAQVVVTTPSAAVGYTLSRDRLLRSCRTVHIGDEIPPEELADSFTLLGFASVDAVESAGQFAVRGGILDFWGADSEYPTRVEFFGDEVDRIAYFDPVTQRTVEMTDRFEIMPAMEVTVGAAEREALLGEIDILINSAVDDGTKDRLKRERAVVEANILLDSRDRFLGVIYPDAQTLTDHLSYRGRPTVFIMGTNDCLDELKKHIERLDGEREELIKAGLASERCAVYSRTLADYSSFISSCATVHVNSFAGGVGSMKLGGLFGFRCRRPSNYGGNASMLYEDLAAFRRGLYRTVLVCDNEVGAASLMEALRSADFAPVGIFDPQRLDILSAEGGEIFITVGACEGFELISPKIAVLSMARDEGRAIMAQRRRKRIMKSTGGAAAIMSHAELSVGDYVVHASYGIGLFEGIETVTVDGVTKDYITVRYAGTDKLFVPCDKLELIGKYIGNRDADGKVKLSKMGGADWNRTKAKAKRAAKDIAKELVALYAKRQRTPGFAFPEDSELEYSFADAFQYELTDSQAAAVEEIKRDMIRPVPMNRLLCGDVGFGKTEVALRAAFKAVMGGKQVAILVPTTILALQHYQTALSRMNGYPVNIDMLSRFKKPKEQEEILRRVKRGETDILIGTHKLLSKQLEFRDLGLLIVDEEQRFGVAQKERLKEFTANVDVLTLSATPIPRTLNMAMSGISDISVLDEAPGERRPVQTYVLEQDDTVLFSAIERELAREGQVLYLYNKVEDIYLVADRIEKRFPSARVATAHGRMEKDELEDIWQYLVRGEIDVLVSTTIIETGVDLPGANTLIIENADRFGLSQLHQIRGRVGRSERQAYAYFTYRAGKALSEIAEKRLNAIKEYAEFGAGFRIALCDLEIRGAGNLLGAEQHGYIESVGYDLYMKILSEAVTEESGREVPKRKESHIDIKVTAHIPESYIASSAHRMEMYKKISLITSKEDADDIRDEFCDRFGDMPKSTERLIEVALAKALAESAGVDKAELTGGNLILHVQRPDLALWSEVFAQNPGMRFAPTGDRVIYRMRDGEVTAKLCSILTTLDECKQGANNP